MVREKGMMGDMFGNMSFDSSDEEDGVVETEPPEEEVAVGNVGDEVQLSPTTGVHSGSEAGYQPENGPAILVRQIRERGLSFQLWPAATGMCRYLEMSFSGGGGGGESLRGARVLELGAGTGMAGVMAARLGARVTLTDLPHVLQNLQQNVELNVEDVEACGGSLDVQPLRWGVKEDVGVFSSQPPDFILASDCVYYDTLFEPLMQTLKWLFGVGEGEKEKGAVGPVLLLAHLRRWKKDGQFFRMAAKWFNVEVVYKHPPPENVRIGVIVYKFTRKLSSR
ncbi:hypothetical protein M758_2G101500 [Ceratodon purpureus]|nr:hypothetical protein M758_2G101500 [Ceratodon purpureus]